MALDTMSRREKIIEILCMTGIVRVECLSQQFGVSCITIRSDLCYLEKSCALRSYGGTMLNQQFVFDRPLRDKGHINRDVKLRIAAKVAEYSATVRR